MTGPRIRLSYMLQGVLGTVRELAYDLDSVELGNSTGDEPVTSTFGVSGAATYSDASDFAQALHKVVAILRRIGAPGQDDAYMSRQARLFLGFKKTTDTNRESGWWYSEILDGMAIPEPDYWDMGAFNSTRGYFKFRITHRPWWWYETATNIASANLTNTNNSNYYALPVWFVSGPEGDGQAAFDVKITNNHASASITRISAGLLRGATTATTLIGSWASPITCPSPYQTNEVSVTLTASTVTVSQFPSGQARVMLKLDAVPGTNLQYKLDIDGEWRSVEPNHAMVRGPIVSIPSTRISGLTAANITVAMKVRYTGTSTAGTFPAGQLHLFPCDQWCDWRIPAGMTQTHQLVDNARLNFAYVKTGGSSARYDSVIRIGGPIAPVSDAHCLAFMVERSTGATDNADYSVAVSAWPRRRLI